MVWQRKRYGQLIFTCVDEHLLVYFYCESDPVVNPANLYFPCLKKLL